MVDGRKGSPRGKRLGGSEDEACYSKLNITPNSHLLVTVNARSRQSASTASSGLPGMNKKGQWRHGMI